VNSCRLPADLTCHRCSAATGWGAGVRDVAAHRPVGAGSLSQLLGGLLLCVEMVWRGEDLVAAGERLAVVGELGAVNGCHRRVAVSPRRGPATAAPRRPIK
jgi:hypothetical protein